MVSGESPAVARRRLRLALRRARDACGLTQTQVAEALDWSLSKVNRIEKGDVTVSSTDLRALLELFGVTDGDQTALMVQDARTARRRGWWDEARYREHLTSATIQLLQFETQASAIRVFQPTLIPGILQTPAYAQSVVDFWQGQLSDEDRAVRLEVRMRRRDHVLTRPDLPHYLLILDESVLLREVGGPRVTAEQLRALLVSMRERHVVMRVLPLAAGAFMMLGQVVIFDLGDEENAVLYRESILADEIIHLASHVRFHRQIFEQMWERSLSEEASARLVEARAAMLLADLDRKLDG